MCRSILWRDSVDWPENCCCCDRKWQLISIESQYEYKPFTYIPRRILF
jgi:hypothetical protein